MISDERLAEIVLLPEIVDAALDIAERLDLVAEQTIDTSTLVCHLRVLRDDLPDLTRALRAERETLAEIRAVVDEQADDEGLWPIYAMGEQRITEAYLQQELRRLHAVVERVTPDPEEPA